MVQGFGACPEFESSVDSYGGQADWWEEHHENMFESSVDSYGGQAGK